MEPEIVGAQRRRNVFLVVSGAAAVIMAGFAIAYYVEGNMVAMWTDIGMMSGVVAGCIALRLGVDELKVYRPVFLGVLIGLCYLATIRTGLLYYHLAMPLLLFFFFGSREGPVWAGGFFLATVVVLFAPEPVVSPIMETERKVRLLSCYLFVMLVGWSYERSRELFNDLLTSRNQQLQRETERLSHSLIQVREAEGRLEQAAAEMQGRNQLLEAVVNSIGDGVIVVDEKGAPTIFNPAAERILGDHALEVSAQRWTDHYDIFYPDGETRVPREELPLVRTISRGESIDDQDLFVRSGNRPDGVYLRASARPLWNNAGDGRGGVVTFRDVTEQMMAQDALMQAFAQGRLEMVDTILHNIGNAINSVTTGIETVHRTLADDPSLRRLRALADAVEAHRDDWIDYIKNDSQGRKVMPFLIALAGDFASRNEELAKTVGRVKDRANHIADIIRTQDMPSSSKIERVDVNLRTAFEDAVGVLEDSLRKRSVRIDIDCEYAPKEIRIQKSRFHQMIVNLTKNAMEAIDDLTASGGLTEAPCIRLRAYVEGDFLKLEVNDNGIGIAGTNPRILFAAGYTTKKSGSGLGLHSTANFIIGMGGQIRPLSEGIGKGATMLVTLPLSSVTGSTQPRSTVTSRSFSTTRTGH
ncbi:MAG: ATP-binding protein [Deltaproteobacteria bacterium]|nr:ATP-binding protein [Deltaproteobacteria bacterium]